MDNINEMSQDIENNRYYQRLEQTVARLDTLNDKLDKIMDGLSTARVESARVEERVAQIEINKVDYWNRLNRHSEEIDHVKDEIAKLSGQYNLMKRCEVTQEEHKGRIAELELKTAEVLRTTVLINRAFWLFITGFSAYLGNNLFHFL
jgi:chromosome segregation ATPase